jgi:hypothetical protein
MRVLLFKAAMRILKEPLFHFFLIGLMLFGVYDWKSRQELARQSVVVTAWTIEDLTSEFSNDWNREPTPEEVEMLIDDYIRDELAYREGVSQGLDQGDPVIRQRIRQRLEFMAEEQAALLRPSDEELAAFLQNHADRFAEDGVVPELAQIRNMVVFEWENEQRLKFIEQQYAELYEKYDVRIDRRAE